MEKVYNCYGKLLLNVDPVFASDDYMKADGSPNWTEENDNVDGDGFDKTNVCENGEYKQLVILPKGTKLCRYGAATGRTTTFIGTPYEECGLPFVKETVEYHEYEVIADGVSVICRAVKGRVAAMFGSSGGAIQFVHQRKIVNEIETGRLKEVTTWLENRKHCVEKP